MAGEVQETSTRRILKHVYDQNALEKSQVIILKFIKVYILIYFVFLLIGEKNWFGWNYLLNLFFLVNFLKLYINKKTLLKLNISLLFRKLFPQSRRKIKR